MSKYNNTVELSTFVEEFDVRNQFGVSRFTALVTIRTEKNVLINKNMDLMITFDGYDNLGTLTILENDIDPYLYPTKFEAKYDIFEFVEHEYLLIKGRHNRNKDIGEYSVKIIPSKK